LKNTELLSTRKQELYTKNTEIIQYWRRNPIIACRDLLGIRLMDSQKWILQNSWNTPYNVWCCSRDYGKSFLGAILMMLKWMLFENQSIYIISSVGSQAQETFQKIEKIALNRIESIKSLKDVFANETVKSPSNTTGFTHNPSSFRVSSYNGSDIFTLNGKPDNNRSKRASLVFFDEAGFSSEELLTAAIAFAVQDTDFTTSIDEEFSMDTQKRKCPTQLVFASSASDTDSTFFAKYKEYSKKMFIGNTNYFCCDIPCEIPLNPMMDGEPHAPLIKKEQVEDELKTNREKAMREYYNKFLTDGGETQIIKRSQIIRNETFQLPVLANTNKDKFLFAIDPARTYDNSVCSVMRLCEDINIGYYGEIVNSICFVDIGKKKKIPMKTPDQISYFKQMLLNYNGNQSPDYENIKAVLIDSGSGGGGYSAWADNLLEDWYDKSGKKHKGLIDKTNEFYESDIKKFPNASNILQLISPKKYKKQMVEELIELLELDLIKFPKEYNGKGFINIAIDDDKHNVRDIKTRHLSVDEQISLSNIDIMKTETTSIHRFTNAGNTNVEYRLPKDKERIMHDDRFFTLIMLAHVLYELRRSHITNKEVKKQDISKLLNTFKQPQLRKNKL